MKLKKLSIIKLLLYFFLISSSLKSIAISSTYSEEHTINVSVNDVNFLTSITFISKAFLSNKQSTILFVIFFLFIVKKVHNTLKQVYRNLFYYNLHLI